LKEKRFWLGVSLTTLWLIFMVFMLVTSKRPTELNAWGDFFAGFFAPMAFLWLVLGYLQQGEELRNSAAALKLQADELKNSVEQQSNLVDVSRQQLQQELLRVHEERELRRKAAQPNFVLSSGGYSSGVTGITHHIQIFNSGNTTSNVVVRLDPPVNNFTSQSMHILERNREVRLSIDSQSGFQTTAYISYVDAEGIPGRVSVALSTPNGSALQIGPVMAAATAEP
jgi:hypothetical protein